MREHSVLVVPGNSLAGSSRNGIRHIVRLLLLPLGFCVLAAAQDGSVESFGGGYSSLRPEQKRLVDDWFRRSAVVKKPVDPAAGYDQLPLSMRTTFNAVTHALTKTKLTGRAGNSLAGSAIELVDKIDSVAGQVLGAGGDEQFRIYVRMKSGVMDILRQSKEFQHKGKNSIYHKGYPTCFRTRGVPSIQISLSRDASRADIDVDYRSSKFPWALVNGHLSASNSDVRVGDNEARHNSQWTGLQNWWRNLSGTAASRSGTRQGGRKGFSDGAQAQERKTGRGNSRFP